MASRLAVLTALSCLWPVAAGADAWRLVCSEADGDYNLVAELTLDTAKMQAWVSNPIIPADYSGRLFRPIIPASGSQMQTCSMKFSGSFYFLYCQNPADLSYTVDPGALDLIENPFGLRHACREGGPTW